MNRRSTSWLGGLVLAWGALPGIATADDLWSPPIGYYETAAGTGAALEGQLAAIMMDGQIERRYGDFRQSAALHDADPNTPGNILLAYSRESVPASWDSGSTWNREHTWPQSRQPGSASNSSRGNLGDPHALRPADPGVNSSRGNKPFGFGDSAGSNGAETGGFYFPGDADKGDTARQLFYSATRYGDTGLGLVNGSPGSNQMGDLASLLEWHYQDPPDEFERRRNHVIYSQSENPRYYTNNRNAYVDHPEFVHSVFVDQANDSQLWLGLFPPQADGFSSDNLDFGAAIVGADIAVAPQEVTISKSGFDGTYYEVQATGAATSSVEGRFNAFLVNDTGFDTQTILVGMDVDTSSPGRRVGFVTVDNLDVTTGSGTGLGALDADDVATTRFTVFDHSDAGFSGSGEIENLVLDFGTVTAGSAVEPLAFSILNDDAAAGIFTAALDLDAITGSGDTSVLTTDLTVFDSLIAGSSAEFTAVLDTSLAGSFAATYSLATSDFALPGAAVGDTLTLTLLAEVLAAAIAGDYDDNGIVDQGDLNLVLNNWGTVAPFEPNTEPFETVAVDQEELNRVLNNWGSQSDADLTGQGLPEPALGLWAIVAGLCLKRDLKYV